MACTPPSQHGLSRKPLAFAVWGCTPPSPRPRHGCSLRPPSPTTASPWWYASPRRNRLNLLTPEVTNGHVTEFLRCLLSHDTRTCISVTSATPIPVVKEPVSHIRRCLLSHWGNGTSFAPPPPTPWPFLLYTCSRTSRNIWLVSGQSRAERGCTHHFTSRISLEPPNSTLNLFLLLCPLKR